VVAALRAAGAAEIVVTDLHDVPLAVADQVGATRTIRVGTPDQETLKDLNADVAIESSGSAAGFDSCLDAVARGGRVVGLGLLPPGTTPVVLNKIITRELDVAGSFRFDHEMTDVLAALEGAVAFVDPVITATLPVERFGEAFELAVNPSRSCKVLLDFGTETR
jgi:L-idonate 5-dehydrogenase